MPTIHKKSVVSAVWNLIADDISEGLIRFPNRLSSIAEIVAHNTSVVCRLGNEMPESLSELAKIPLQEVLNVLDPTKRQAKLCAVFSIARALRVSPETILGFDHAGIGVRRN